ncbi:N-acetyltransferase [Propioniciclava coleopterorum]|uniref:N-acetyltransferase n=1 Tax=Propioniciclava coleopterorum TaxID=2714937 RepID=A0A6G7Y9C2_9ACTN|nr:GNAT family N-acetyltransferase [Propioniciclava coleopterorum]QIK73393.1 N-acetyltransferase [Propioniciclava coleopterorum]
MSEVSISNNRAAHRYEVTDEGNLAGFAEYLRTDGLVTFTHTEIDPAFEGRGLGSQLIRAALDDVRAEGGLEVLPLCPFVKGWMARHPDYRDLAYGRNAAS